jgi:hypothetical protein
MIVETLFAGMDNTFSLQFMRGEFPVNLLQLSQFKLEMSNGRVFDDQSLFIKKTKRRPGNADDAADGSMVDTDGILEVIIGPLLTDEDKGSHTCWMTSYDPINTNGVRWPNFKLKVK